MQVAGVNVMKVAGVATRASFAPTARKHVLRASAPTARKLSVARAMDRAGEKGTIVDEKDKKDLAGDEVVFKPFKEGAAELSIVEQASMNKNAIEDSFARVGYHQDAEYAVNEQVNIEYNMSYVYHAMSTYFNRDNVALPGLAAYFRAQSDEERGHAQLLMDFQAVRGGRTKLAHLTAPQAEYQHETKGDALHAMELALSLEKLNFQKLRHLHDVAEESKDAQMSDFVEDMLADQAKEVKEVADYVAQLRRIGKGHGVFHFDQVMAEDATRLATPSSQYTT